MAWETRGGQGRYYTRSKKRDGRVVREYIGTGPLAERIAGLDEAEREDRRERLQARRQLRADLAAADAPVAALHAEVDAMVEMALVAAGFHRHKGTWRRRRG